MELVMLREDDNTVSLVISNNLDCKDLFWKEELKYIIEITYCCLLKNKE